MPRITRDSEGGVGRILYRLRMRLRGWKLVKNTLEFLGITRIGKRIYESSLLRGGVHHAVVMGCRLRLSVRSSEEIERIDHFYEIELVGKIIAVLRKGDVVWDVGANVGMVSLLLAAQRPDLDLRIHGFEPEPRNANEFQRNIELNGLAKSIIAHRFGLADRNETVSLYVMNDIGDGRHSILPEAAAGRTAVPIQVRRADDVAGGDALVPDVVKIDVEGAEMRVLDGMDPLLKQQRIREIFIELHVPRLQAAGVSSADVEALFTERGYELAWSTPRGTEIHQHYRRKGASGA